MVKTVAFLFHNTDMYTGASRSLIEMVISLDRDKVRPIAVLPKADDAMKALLDEHGIKSIYCPYHGNTYSLTKMKTHPLLTSIKAQLVRFYNILCGVVLAYKLKRINIDVVYTNTCTLYIGVIIKMLDKSIKHIWHIREFVKDSIGCGVAGGMSHFYRMMDRYSDSVIFISKALESDYHGKISKPDTYVVYNCISENYIQHDTDLYRHGEKINILMCGNIIPMKGHLQVIQAMEILKMHGIPFHLYIAGDFTDKVYYSMLQKEIRDKDLEDSITFLGVVKEMNSLRRKTKFTIVASIKEAFGRVTIESMLSRHVVIATDCGANSELIISEHNGMLYEYGDYEKLSEIIIGLFKNPGKAESIAVNAFEYAKQFVTSTCSDQVCSIICGEKLEA